MLSVADCVQASLGPCASSPCQNGGTCLTTSSSDGVLSAVCLCTDGLTGDDCSVAGECVHARYITAIRVIIIISTTAIVKMFVRLDSGAGTNLKVGEEGARPAPEKNWSRPSTFLALKVQLVVLMSAFVMVSTVWSVSCLLLFYSWCPRAQPFVKVRAHASSALYGVGATVVRRCTEALIAVCDYMLTIGCKRFFKNLVY